MTMYPPWFVSCDKGTMGIRMFDGPRCRVFGVGGWENLVPLDSTHSGDHHTKQTRCVCCADIRANLGFPGWGLELGPWPEGWPPRRSPGDGDADIPAGLVTWTAGLGDTIRAHFGGSDQAEVEEKEGVPILREETLGIHLCGAAPVCRSP